MKQLWAPWRLAYVDGSTTRTRPSECIFCLRDLASEDEERQVLHRGETALVLMNRYPYTNGHLLVAPFRHLPDPRGLSDGEASELHRLVCRCCDVLTEALRPEGFNIGMNLGSAAGAGVADHMHLHVVPRWAGDTNFMPVLDDVRVIPQHLQETYLRLRHLFQKESA